MNLLEKAILLAVESHAGQEDKNGMPYILHPLHLMLQMEHEDEMIAAVLHDVLEDTAVDMEKLREMGLPDHVLQALRLLTHETAGSSYESYIESIRANSLARRVKLADLSHNMDIQRLPHPLTARDWGRLEKYRRAWELLQEE